MFLNPWKSYLQKFLDVHQPLPSYRSKANEILSMIHPTGLVKDINAEVYNLSLHDVYISLPYQGVQCVQIAKHCSNN